MDYQVIILSGDAVFSRMLELELGALRLSVLATARLEEQDRADLLILDLDSAIAPPPEQYRSMIGFSRRPAMLSQDARSCTMILRRPFSMSSLRREVLEQTGAGMILREIPVSRRERDGVREIVLNAASKTLCCDGKTVSLSPAEYAVVECLLEHRGSAVSRDDLSERIGKTDTNKTDVYVCYLRRKTDGLPGGRLIRTVRGKGYMIP